MSKLFSLLSLLLVSALASAQDYYHYDNEFDIALQKIVQESGLNGDYDVGEDGQEQISFAVIDMTGETPVFGGVNCDNFIYPASVYKIYVGMEVLRQISEGKYSLYDPYIIKAPNDVDRRKEISYDPRPLIRDGDTLTIGYLLDLMITRSDNSAANCMIDLAGRENINKTMYENGWHGSEVTRKFLSRKFEDPGYDTIRGTETNARHAADFMYKIYTDQLVNAWVSQQMKSLLERQLDTLKLSGGLPHEAMFYHKTGWWSYFTNDVGIVDDGDIRYIIALFTPVREEAVRLKMKEVSAKVHMLIKERNK